MDDNLAQSTMASVYYSLNRKGFFWDSIGSLAWNAYKSKRVVVAGSVSRTAEGDWNGYQAGLSSQVGFSAVMGPISFRPSVGLSYAFLDQDSYTEDGGGDGVDLSIDSSTFQTLRANAELRISGIFSKEPQLMPYLRGGISQELMDTDPEVNGSFVSSGSTFALKSNKLDDSVPFVGAGLSMVGGYSRLTVEYTGQLGSKYTSHQGVVTASLMF
jgi:outer membrane autotransporter protein